MPPSTKNLREKIEEAVKRDWIPVVDGKVKDGVHHAVEEWFRDKCNSEQRSRSAISSEYGVPPLADWIAELLSSELSLAIKELREAVSETLSARREGESYDRQERALSSFDAKAKEILGESS